MRRYLAFALHVFLAWSLVAAPSRACAPAWPRGESVRIATESALIIWDEKAKTQHFIRRASFETRIPYFGFLVPTPTQPTLAEAPDELFQHLEEWTKPEKKTRIVFEEVTFGCAAASRPTIKAGRVQELARYHLAGYEAAILKADDAEALQGWLEKHHYDARPELIEWLEPYIRAGWIITAFQVTKADERQDSLSMRTVRMTFQTDRPFFPYREPADLRLDERGPRLLRLFVLSGRRMQGELDEPGTRWPGRAVWANPLGADRRQTLAGLLGARQAPVPEGAWLTVFDDDSSPRPGGADLFFSPSADQSTLQREPIYEEHVIPAFYSCGSACFLVLAGPVGLWILVRWRRKRGAARPR